MDRHRIIQRDHTARPERGDQDCLWDDQGDSNVHGGQVVEEIKEHGTAE